MQKKRDRREETEGKIQREIDREAETAGKIKGDRKPKIAAERQRESAETECERCGERDKERQRWRHMKRDGGKKTERT
jgi:hypothetical protein